MNKMELVAAMADQAGLSKKDAEKKSIESIYRFSSSRIEKG